MFWEKNMTRWKKSDEMLWVIRFSKPQEDP